jgi:hypothetical protein
MRDMASRVRWVRNPAPSTSVSPHGRLTPRFLARLDAVLEKVARDCPSGRVALLGPPAVTPAVRRRWRDVDVVGTAAADRVVCGDEAVDVVVSVGVLATAADPAASLRDHARVARAHLVVTAPRGLRGRAGPGWRTSAFVRLASTVGSVADVARAPGATIVWVRVG